MKSLWLTILLAVVVASYAAEMSDVVNVAKNPALLKASMEEWAKAKASPEFSGYVVKHLASVVDSGSLGHFVPLPFGGVSNVCGNEQILSTTVSKRIHTLDQMFTLLKTVSLKKQCKKIMVTFAHSFGSNTRYPSMASFAECNSLDMNGDYELGKMMMMPKMLPGSMPISKKVCSLVVFSLLHQGGIDVIKYVPKAKLIVKSIIEYSSNDRSGLLSLLHQLKPGDIADYAKAVATQKSTGARVADETGFAKGIYNADKSQGDESMDLDNFFEDDNVFHPRHHRHRHHVSRTNRILFFVGSGLLALTVVYTLYCAICSCRRQANIVPMKSPAQDNCPQYSMLVEEDHASEDKKLPSYSDHTTHVIGPVAV